MQNKCKNINRYSKAADLAVDAIKQEVSSATQEGGYSLETEYK